MLGVPAMYYHGTGSENAGRAYTEAPMQHVQRNALRKKCMKSTFTLLEIRTSKYLLLFLLYLSICLLYTFFHHHPVSFSHSLSLYIFFTFFLSLYLQKSPMRDLSKYNISWEFFLNRPTSFIAFRSFLPSSIPYGKCILIPKCISMHRVLL